jgi:hypothetical protein
MKNVTLLFVIAAIIISCKKTGKRAFEKGDYFSALMISVEKLKRDNDNPKALEVLPQAYKLAQKELLSDINKIKNTSQQFKFEAVMKNYDKLNQMYSKIEKCSPCKSLVSPANYFDEFETNKELASDERYKFATNLLNKGTIENGRQAYQNFTDLANFSLNYKDVNEKIEDALFTGSYHVVVEQPAINSKMYQYSNEYFQGKIDEYLQTNRRINKFIRFYQPQEAKEIKLKPDHIVRLEFIEFVVGETNRTSEKTNVTSKDSVKTGTVKIEGKTIDVFDRVNATVIKNTKTVRSKGILAMEIFDFKTNRTLLREQLPGEFYWTNEWASFNGDERALTESEIIMTKKTEILPPDRQQMFVEFCKPIYNQFTTKIKKFYDRY